MNTKYSIIIPVYNAQKTIRTCLDSIICQTIDKLEIIIINDGSTDRSLKICENYQKNDNRIKIITQKNSGPSVARNNGIKKAIGKYVIFIDADDYIQNDFFEVIEKYMNADLDVLKFNIKYHGNRISEDLFNTKSFALLNGEIVLEIFIDNNKIFATPWMYVFKKQIFIENNLFFSEQRIHEDYGLIPCLLIKSKSIMGIDYFGYNYVYRKGSLSTNQSYKEIVRRAFDMLVHYDFLYEFGEVNINDKKIETKFKNYIKENLLKKVKRLNGKELLEFNNKLYERNVVINYEN